MFYTKINYFFLFFTTYRYLKKKMNLQNKTKKTNIHFEKISKLCQTYIIFNFLLIIL